MNIFLLTLLRGSRSFFYMKTSSQILLQGSASFRRSMRAHAIRFRLLSSEGHRLAFIELDNALLCREISAFLKKEAVFPPSQTAGGKTGYRASGHFFCFARVASSRAWERNRLANCMTGSALVAGSGMKVA